MGTTMIVLISGSNRPNNNSGKIATIAQQRLEARGQDVFRINLENLPPTLFTPASYAEKPAGFEEIQKAVLATDGFLTVVPEYNGSFPGALKYFIDMLRFPESLVGKPAGFIGVAAGQWGALRAVEQLEMVFQYRHAHLYGKRVFLPGICGLLDDEGQLTDDDANRRLEEMVDGFVTFCEKLSR